MPIEETKTDSISIDTCSNAPTSVAFFVTLEDTKDKNSTTPASSTTTFTSDVNMDLHSFANCDGHSSSTSSCERPSAGAGSMKSNPRMRNPDEEIPSYIPNSELCCDSLDCPKAQYCLANNTTDGIPSYLECISAAMTNNGSNEEVDNCCGNITCPKKSSTNTNSTTATKGYKPPSQTARSTKPACDEYFAAFVPARNCQNGFTPGRNLTCCDHHDDNAPCYFENFSSPSAPSCSSSSCRRAELFGSYFPNSKNGMTDEASMKSATNDHSCRNRHICTDEKIASSFIPNQPVPTIECRNYGRNREDEYGVPSYVSNTCSTCFTEDNCATCQRPIYLRDPNHEVATYIPYSSCSSSAVYNNTKATAEPFCSFNAPRVCRTHDQDVPSFVANEYHACYNVPKQSMESNCYSHSHDDDVPSFMSNSPNCENCSYIFMPCDDHYDSVADDEDYGASYLPNCSPSGSCSYFHLPPHPSCRNHEEGIPSYIPSSSSGNHAAGDCNVKTETSQTTNTSSTASKPSTAPTSKSCNKACEKTCCSNGEHCRIPNASSEEAIPSYIPASGPAAQSAPTISAPTTTTGENSGQCSKPKNVNAKSKLTSAKCASCNKHSAHVHNDDEEIASYIPSGTRVCNEHRPSTRRAPTMRSTTNSCGNTCCPPQLHAAYPGMRRVATSAPRRYCSHQEDEIMGFYVPSGFESCSMHSQSKTLIPLSCGCPPSNRMGVGMGSRMRMNQPQHLHRRIGMPRSQCPQKLRRNPRVPVRKVHASCQGHSTATCGQNSVPRYKCNSKSQPQSHQFAKADQEEQQQINQDEIESSDSELIEAVLIETLGLLA